MTTDTTGRTIERTLRIDAPVEVVWNAIIEGDEIRRWFAERAECTPGEGGVIRLGWGDGMRWDMPIVEWEEGRRLVLEDAGEYGSEGFAQTRADRGVTIRYELEPSNGGTTLHLVHAGFGHESGWDEVYEATSGGWTYELRSLRHYVEHHLGEERALAWARTRVPEDRDAAWRTLMGPGALNLTEDAAKLREGDAAHCSPSVGGAISGTVMVCSPPRDLGIAIDQHNHAILRAAVERWCGETSTNLSAMVWFSLWGDATTQRDAIESSWQGLLEKAFA